VQLLPIKNLFTISDKARAGISDEEIFFVSPKKRRTFVFFHFSRPFFFRGHAAFSCGIYCGVLRMAGRGMRRNNQEKARICLDSLYCHFFYWLLL
jgi:hypothetical protein